MIAVDTNILVYAHRKDSPWNEAAVSRVAALAEGRATWAIAWPSLHEFFAIVTHARVFAPPTPLDRAIEQIEAWLEAPNLMLLAETDVHWQTLRDLLQTGRVQGPMMHDACIVALCVQHGVSELWSADRDFNRFPGVKVVKPLLRYIAQ